MPAAETEIIDVLHDYSRALDDKNWGLLLRVFADDGAMESPASTITGATTLAAHMERLHGVLDGSAHRLSNIQVVVDGDTAKAHSYLDAILVRRGAEGGDTFRVSGVYDDEFVREDGAWRIRRRTFSALWREGNPGVLGVPSAVPGS